LSSQGVYCDIVCHFCEGSNPENSLPSSLDARLRGHDGKNTPTPQIIIAVLATLKTWSTGTGFFILRTATDEISGLKITRFIIS